jgi:hypothetical protein
MKIAEALSYLASNDGYITGLLVSPDIQSKLLEVFELSTHMKQIVTPFLSPRRMDNVLLYELEQKSKCAELYLSVGQLLAFHKLRYEPSAAALCDILTQGQRLWLVFPHGTLLELQRQGNTVCFK